jgi:hypothetical protein
MDVLFNFPVSAFCFQLLHGEFRQDEQDLQDGVFLPSAFLLLTSSVLSQVELALIDGVTPELIVRDIGGMGTVESAQ